MPIFLGHCVIPLGPIIVKKKVSRWYHLSTLANDTKLLPSKSKKDKKHHQDDGYNRARDFVKDFQQAEGEGAVLQQVHRFVDKTYALGNCSICSKNMMGTQLNCSVCGMGCHQKCQENAPSICGGVGAIRLKIEFSKCIILPQNYYSTVIECLKKDNFQILIMIGKVSSFREEIAKCFISIMDFKSSEFVASVVKQEIMGHDEPKTLFRANSMASKALDIFMKTEGADYLRNTLEDVLRLIIYSKKPFELDATRWEQNQPNKKKKEIVEEAIDVNIANLIEVNLIIIERIFASAPKMPQSLREIFFKIQTTVEEKFPKNNMVRYTSVSGFLFLRFFAPAILGPSLFNLRVGIIDVQSSRKLTLIAKTLQNLSNFVEFGQKEPFMGPMNALITSSIPKMKAFIDCVSSAASKSESAPRTSKALPTSEIAKESAELCKLVSSSMDKLKGINPPSPHLQHLGEALEVVEAKVKETEEADLLLPYNVCHDVGENIHEGIIVDTQEDKSLLKMLTRFTNLDKGAAGPSPIAPVANYRNSMDIRDLMSKGKIELAQIPLIQFDLSTNHEPKYGFGQFIEDLQPKLSEMSTEISVEEDEEDFPEDYE